MTYPAEKALPVAWLDEKLLLLALNHKAIETVGGYNTILLVTSSEPLRHLTYISFQYKLENKYGPLNVKSDISTYMFHRSGRGWMVGD